MPLRDWTPEQRKVLERYIEKYEGERNHKSKQMEVAKSAVEELMKIPGETVAVPDTALDGDVRAWLANKTRKRQSLVYQVHKKPSELQVVSQRYKAQIVESVKAKYGVVSGEPAFIGKFQREAGELARNLNEDQQKEVDLDRAKWKKEGPPPEARKDPNLQISHILLRVAQEIYFLTGARIHTLAGYECGDGTKQVTVFDYNNFLGPCSVQFQKHTRNHQVIMDEWTKYTSEYVGNTGERAVVKGKIALNKRAPVKLSINKFGEPVILQSNIPTISTAGTLETMKGVLRAFLSGHYNLARGQYGPIPFGSVMQNNRAFFDEEWAPAGVVIKDPSKMNKAAIMSCLEMWKCNDGELDEQKFCFTSVVMPAGGDPVHLPYLRQEFEDEDSLDMWLNGNRNRSKQKKSRKTNNVASDHVTAPEEDRNANSSEAVEEPRVAGGDKHSVAGGDPPSFAGGDRPGVTGGDPHSFAGADPPIVDDRHPSRFPGGDRSGVTGGDPPTFAGGDPPIVADGDPSSFAGEDRSGVTGGHKPNVDSGIAAGSDADVQIAGDTGSNVATEAGPNQQVHNQQGNVANIDTVVQLVDQTPAGALGISRPATRSTKRKATSKANREAKRKRIIPESPPPPTNRPVPRPRRGGATTDNYGHYNGDLRRSNRFAQV